MLITSNVKCKTELYLKSREFLFALVERKKPTLSYFPLTSHERLTTPGMGSQSPGPHRLISHVQKTGSLVVKLSEAHRDVDHTQPHTTPAVLKSDSHRGDCLCTFWLELTKIIQGQARNMNRLLSESTQSFGVLANNPIGCQRLPGSGQGHRSRLEGRGFLTSENLSQSQLPKRTLQNNVLP